MTVWALLQLNPDFAVEIVARVSNTKQISVSGYFLDEIIVNYFEFKKCSERLSCEVFGSRSKFQLQIWVKEDIRNIELSTAELHAAGQLEKLIAKLDNVISKVVLDLKNENKKNVLCNTIQKHLNKPPAY